LQFGVPTEWAQGLKRLLGKKIVGLYLSGSLAYRDFVPDRSDIDLQAVVRNPLTEDELRSVEQLHRQVERGCPEWATGLSAPTFLLNSCTN
jgi:hypothetical protein